MKLATLLLLLGSAGAIIGLSTGASSLFAERRADENARTSYFANGQLESRIEIVEGKKNGPCERWYPNGTKQATGSFKDDRMEGEWSFWSADGVLDGARSGTYHDGTKLD